MTIEEIISVQKKKRKTYLDAILLSKSKKKIIVASAGTGKTYTLREVLLANPGGKSIAMTFINRLTDDMNASFGHLAEVKTFHAYCKKILHEQNGKVDLKAFLTKIIEDDAEYLHLALKDFDKKFQMLDEQSPEIAFYLKRGDYYDAVSFNDSVYRLYKKLCKNARIISEFNLILIDEYQDFNPMEVAFIDELEKRGSILIIGDDDQAVYDSRCASPDYLREKYNSGKYERFELPYCSRCPEVIVNAANAILSSAEAKGFLKGRIQKKYECFLSEKGKDGDRFPKIVTVRCTTAKVAAKYVYQVVQNIDKDDIKESWKEGREYYTVLIAGPKHYLDFAIKELTGKYPNLTHKFNEEKPHRIVDGYDILLTDESNNLGWRVLIDFYFSLDDVRVFIDDSAKGIPMRNILAKKFIERQKRVIEIIRIIKSAENFTAELNTELKGIVGKFHDDIVEYYSPKELKEGQESDKTRPSILLSSFVGCKGLSAGHVIILGANDGCIPKNPKSIEDVEISQFVVALTRTRKQCHIVSNEWYLAPTLKGISQQHYEKTSFLKWIPWNFLDDKGSIKSKDIR